MKTPLSLELFVIVSLLIFVAPETSDVMPTLGSMKDVTVLEGAPATFKTQVNGKPKPSIQWYREGALIPQSPDFQVNYHS